MDSYIYTTSEVAKICEIAVRTVCKLIDKGELKGYRLPGSSHRRVREKDLIEFMTRVGIPIPPRLQIKSGPVLLGPGIPEKEAFVFFKDGDQWACVRSDFQNLQESKAGFGPTLYEAQQSLLDDEGAPPPKWRLWIMGSSADGHREGRRCTEAVFRSLEEGIKFIEEAVGVMGYRGDKASKQGDWWVANNHGLQPIEEDR